MIEFMSVEEDPMTSNGLINASNARKEDGDCWKTAQNGFPVPTWPESVNQQIVVQRDGKQ